MPTTELSNRTISLLDAMIEAKIVSSKGQAKDLINQGGISLNDEKITDIKYMLSEKDFEQGFAIIQKGKKVFHKIQ
jgi:tyrosyl-tRNA synthetase